MKGFYVAVGGTSLLASLLAGTVAYHILDSIKIYFQTLFEIIHRELQYFIPQTDELKVLKDFRVLNYRIDKFEAEMCSLKEIIEAHFNSIPPSDEQNQKLLEKWRDIEVNVANKFHNLRRIIQEIMQKTKGATASVDLKSQDNMEYDSGAESDGSYDPGLRLESKT